MDNLKEIKKQIKEDWLKNFAELKAYNQSSFYKIVGCTLIGFELVRLPYGIAKYRPYFICYPLSRKDLKECLLGPYILKDLIYEYSGNSLEIPYSEHCKYMSTAIEFVNAQIPISLTGDVALNHYLKMINTEINRQGIPVFEELGLYILKFNIALYVNNAYLIAKSVNEIENLTKRYPIEWFDNRYRDKYGSFNNWFTELKNKVNNRGEFLEQIEKNKQDPKLKKLYVSEIIL